MCKLITCEFSIQKKDAQYNVQKSARTHLNPVSSSVGRTFPIFVRLYRNLISSFVSSTLLVNRFPDEDSLFHYKPLIERHHQTEKLFCLCSLNDSIEKKRKCPACESKCRRHQHVLWPVVSRERDITRRVQSLQEGRALERRHNLSDEFNPLQANPSDQPNLFDDGKPDTLLAVLAVISYCKRLLTDTPLGKACNAVLGQQNVDKLLKICIRDMRVCLTYEIIFLPPPPPLPLCFFSLFVSVFFSISVTL